MVFSDKAQENKLISEYLGFKFVFLFIKTTQSKSKRSE